MSEIRLLSLWQPWATWIALGFKQIETRSWGTSYRGSIAIQASLRRVDWAAVDHLRRTEPGAAAIPTNPEAYPVGCILTVVELVDCLKMTEASRPKEGQINLHSVSSLEFAVGDWDINRWAWVLANNQPLQKPIRCKGAQGLRKFQHQAMLSEIDRQLGTELSGAIPQMQSVGGAK